MRKNNYIMRCIHCGKEYDLLKATNKSKGMDVRCPHCNNTVGRRNS